jgi:hypothetical protein
MEIEKSISDLERIPRQTTSALEIQQVLGTVFESGNLIMMPGEAAGNAEVQTRFWHSGLSTLLNNQR